MATPLAFIPRIVTKHSKPWNGISRIHPSPSLSPETTTDDQDSDEQERTKSNEKTPSHVKQWQDIATLVALALSDYNIWHDSDLRWKLEACLGDDNEAGFVPINYILRRAPYRGSLLLRSEQPEPSETEIVKALRTHASHTLEVRMRLPSSSASSSVWLGTGKTSRKKDVGGYEVRRRDWHTLRDRSSRGWTRAPWDDMTAYIEGIPPQYRTVGGIVRFAETLVLQGTGMGQCVHVQNVFLPPHYLDKPGDTPKCKGYALVTLSTKSSLEAILHAWPWKRHRVLPSASGDGDGGTDVLPSWEEAHKYGLRAISKARWEKLNEEYLIYKQSLVDEMMRTQTEVHPPAERVTERESEREVWNQPAIERQTTATSSYPLGCLVFVRNVNLETNKTTLKSFFGQAFREDKEGYQCQAPTGLDYVDFTKGMDSCYLRLTSPRHATRLVAYFSAQRKAQADGLDVTGSMPANGNKPIVMELIQGKREELYWDQVPEKVRRQAVDRAVEVQRAGGADERSLASLPATIVPRDDPGRRRKRTKF